MTKGKHKRRAALRREHQTEAELAAEQVEAKRLAAQLAATEAEAQDLARVANETYGRMAELHEVSAEEAARLWAEAIELTEHAIALEAANKHNTSKLRAMALEIRNEFSVRKDQSRITRGARFHSDVLKVMDTLLRANSPGVKRTHEFLDWQAAQKRKNMKHAPGCSCAEHPTTSTFTVK